MFTSLSPQLLRRKLVYALAVAAITAVATTAHAQEATLKLGDAAPPLKVGKWVKGEPVTRFEPGKVYVLEFWATWCGPCKAAIPHVTELQKKYADKVTMIGMNVWEREESKVEPFVTEMGEKMDYRVATDDKSSDEQGLMATTWMQAAGRDGIPCSMVVDQEGRIAWIGHPMELEPVLEKVIAKTWDLKEAGAESEKKNAEKAKTQALQKKIIEALHTRDVDTINKAIDEASAQDTQIAQQAPLLKFQFFLQLKKYDEAYAQADSVYAVVKDSAVACNQIARLLAMAPLEKRDLKFAEKLAQRSVELTERKKSAPLDTLARIQHDQGDNEKAIATQTEAIAVAEDGEKADLEKTLEKYKGSGSIKPDVLKMN